MAKFSLFSKRESGTGNRPGGAPLRGGPCRPGGLRRRRPCQSGTPRRSRHPALGGLRPPRPGQARRRRLMTPWLSACCECDTRYYEPHLRQDLFGTRVLTRVWGGRGTACGGGES